MTTKINRRRLAALGLVVPLLLLSVVQIRGQRAGSRVESGRSTVVYGTVTDAETTRPLPDALVVLPSLNLGVKSDAQGSYQLIVSHPEGAGSVVDVEIGATHAGYSSSYSTVRIEGDSVRVDLMLRKIENRRPEVPEPRELKDRAMEAGMASSVTAMNLQVSPVRREATVRPHIDGDDGRPPFNTEEYDRIYENPFLAVAYNPLSTFSIDVDAASYSNVRRFLMDGAMPPPDAVRIEELINYFDYGYREPSGEDPLSVTLEMGPAPWEPSHRLVHIGLQGERINSEALPPNNLVFLLDVSGSMASPDKLPLLKSALRMLVNQLRAEDRVAIVVYAGAAGLVLPPTSGRNKSEIRNALEVLEAGGSTAGGAGIQLAYGVAREHFDPRANNRVILATDGDFNIGASNTGELVRKIEEQRDHGIYLTVLGFGTGNLKDSRMEQLADKGNGHYAYIDSILEAKKVLVNELGATLVTVAKDVKLQVEFNPALVAAYRLNGYENRLLRDEDFNDDTKDAGELGAGHTVTALYEVIPVGAATDVEIRGVDSLRYGSRRPVRMGELDDEWLAVKVRYKRPDEIRSRLLMDVVRDDGRHAETEAFRFSAAVAAFGMLLRDSEHAGSASYDDVITLARDATGEDLHGYRREFVNLVEIAQAVTVPG